MNQLGRTRIGKGRSSVVSLDEAVRLVKQDKASEGMNTKDVLRILCDTDVTNPVYVVALNKSVAVWLVDD